MHEVHMLLLTFVLVLLMFKGSETLSINQLYQFLTAILRSNRGPRSDKRDHVSQIGAALMHSVESIVEKLK